MVKSNKRELFSFREELGSLFIIVDLCLEESET